MPRKTWKVYEMREGQIWELDVFEEGEGLKPIQFEILEEGWFPSPTSPGALFHGVRIRGLETGEEEILSFFAVEFARRVDQS